MSVERPRETRLLTVPTAAMPERSAISSEKRLARTLLILANFGKEGGPQPIATPISQQTLAEIVGTTRPRVSHFMNKFRKLGFISGNGHLQAIVPC